MSINNFILFSVICLFCSCTSKKSIEIQNKKISRIDKIEINNYVKRFTSENRPFVDYYISSSSLNKEQNDIRCYFLFKGKKIPLIKKHPKDHSLIFRLQNHLLFNYSLFDIEKMVDTNRVLLVFSKDSFFLVRNKLTQKTFYLDGEKIGNHNVEKMSAYIDLKKYINDFYKPEE